MKKLIALSLVLIASSVVAQGAGTVSVVSTVTASAGTVVCTFSNAAAPTIHTVCTVNSAQALVSDVTPAVGSTSGNVGTFSNGTDAVSWQIQQPTAGSLTWSITANGTTKSGTF